MKHLITHLKKNEAGNALFLILIAVALFAALSYAVTQSGRGGGNVDRETALIAASQMTQYAAGLRTTVTRMVITGTPANSLEFETTTGASDEVFDSAGGGAIEQDPPANVASAATTYEYLVPATDSTGWYIVGIGGDGPDVFMVTDPTIGLTDNVCDEINRGLGITGVIPANGATFSTATAATWDGSASQATVIDSTDGEAFACIPTNSLNMYFHALVEQ